jgi:hypothetical protein
MNTPVSVSRYWVPRWIVERSWSILRQDGLKDVESTVTWGGIRFGQVAVVMAVIYPCGHDVEFRRDLLRVGPDTTAEMGRWLRGQNLAGMIQVHTHPDLWSGHSTTDDDFPIASSEGFVSLVWPSFARLPVDDPSEWGVHRLERGRWRSLSGDDARQLLHIVESEGLVWPPRLGNRMGHAQELGGEER